MQPHSSQHINARRACGWDLIPHKETFACKGGEMLHLVTWMLFSGISPGCLSWAFGAQRKYHLVTSGKTWDEAQKECREMFTDLATVSGHDDMEQLVNMTVTSGETREIWIGLRETGPAAWQWSVGETPTSPGLVEFTNWATSPSDSEHCGGMLTLGKWLSAPCKTKHPFACQNKRAGGMYVVESQKKTWSEAQRHCRANGGDLASVRNQSDNQILLTKIGEHDQGPCFFWIGLFKDEWQWSDGDKSSFRDWTSGQPNNDGECTLYSPSAKRWYDRGCGGTYPFYCYGAKKVKYTIWKVELQSSSVVNVNNVSVQQAILNQLQNNTHVKVQWRIQQDGKVFHEKEEKESKS